MLLSHAEGIRGVKSLLHAHSPSSFIADMRKLYKSLAAVEASCKTDRIGEDVHGLALGHEHCRRQIHRQDIQALHVDLGFGWGCHAR